MELTARFGLPLLVAGQAQKDVTHNEALVLIDAMVGCVVERRDLATPPVAPVNGSCWLVPPSATGMWDGKAGQIAVATDGGWRFQAAPDGFAVFVREGRERLRRHDGSWVADAANGAPGEAVAAPAGGTVIDSEARATLATLLDRLEGLGLLVSN